MGAFLSLTIGYGHFPIVPCLSLPAGERLPLSLGNWEKPGNNPNKVILINGTTTLRPHTATALVGCCILAKARKATLGDGWAYNLGTGPAFPETIQSASCTYSRCG